MAPANTLFSEVLSEAAGVTVSIWGVGAKPVNGTHREQLALFANVIED